LIGDLFAYPVSDQVFSIGKAVQAGLHNASESAVFLRFSLDPWDDFQQSAIDRLAALPRPVPIHILRAILQGI
jgi:hypothetical protein